MSVVLALAAQVSAPGLECPPELVDQVTHALQREGIEELWALTCTDEEVTLRIEQGKESPIEVRARGTESDRAWLGQTVVSLLASVFRGAPARPPQKQPSAPLTEGGWTVGWRVESSVYGSFGLHPAPAATLGMGLQIGFVDVGLGVAGNFAVTPVGTVLAGEVGVMLGARWWAWRSGPWSLGLRAHGTGGVTAVAGLPRVGIEGASGLVPSGIGGIDATLMHAFALVSAGLGLRAGFRWGPVGTADGTRLYAWVGPTIGLVLVISPRAQ